MNIPEAAYEAAEKAVYAHAPSPHGVPSVNDLRRIYLEAAAPFIVEQARRDATETENK